MITLCLLLLKAVSFTGRLTVKLAVAFVVFVFYRLLFRLVLMGLWRWFGWAIGKR